jgi:hypothetical protein
LMEVVDVLMEHAAEMAAKSMHPRRNPGRRRQEQRA